MADVESEVESLKRDVKTWRERCEAAANLGKQLVVSKVALQDENADLKRQVEQLRHLEQASAKDDSARRVQELLAVSLYQLFVWCVRVTGRLTHQQRVRVLQDQLHDAELLNQQLSKDLQLKEARPRSTTGGGGRRNNDDNVRHSGSPGRDTGAAPLCFVVSHLVAVVVVLTVCVPQMKPSVAMSWMWCASSSRPLRRGPSVRKRRSS